MQRTNDSDIAPCYGCQDRHLNCWSECERYAAMKARNARIKENKRIESQKWTVIWKGGKKSGH